MYTLFCGNNVTVFYRVRPGGSEMLGPVAGSEHHVPGLHGRSQADPTFGVTSQPRGLREVVRAVRGTGSVNLSRLQ